METPNLLSLDFLVRESNREYRKNAARYLSSHALADFRHCPALYWKKKQGLVGDEDRPAYFLGRAGHVLILEGRPRFDEEYVVGGPINPKTGKPFGPLTQAFAEWVAAQGKPVLTEEQFALLTHMAAGVTAHAGACELLSQGIAEGVVRAEYCGLPCQTRMDWFNPSAGIVDLKTCDDLTWFEADARRYGYIYQLAFYRAVLALAIGSVLPVHLIAVEKKEPYRCGVWLIDTQALTYAQTQNEQAIARLKECQATGSWPTGYEERRVFDAL